MTEPERIEIETKDFEVIYCNQASISLSFNDVRLFLSEALPQTVEVGPGKPEMKIRNAAYRQRVSLVLVPEFARSLAKVLDGAIAQYEKSFGPLRPEPSPESIVKSFSKSE